MNKNLNNSSKFNKLMSNYNFNTYLTVENYFNDCYRKLGVYKYDFIYIYSDFRYFATKFEKINDKEKFCNSVVKSLLEQNITIVVPTFSYTKNGIFDVEKTKTNLGTLNSWILEKENHKRSEHPIFSFGSLGTQDKIVENCGKSAFGKNSIHDRLKNKNCGFLNIGRPIEKGNTIIHHVEQMNKARYRFEKKFKTVVKKHGKFYGTNYSAFVRRLDIKNNELSYDFKKGTKLIYEHAMIDEISNTEMLSNISLYDYDKTYQVLTEGFLKNHSIFLEEPFKDVK